MSQHTLAVLMLICLVANEGYALAKWNDDFVWKNSMLISYPFLIFSWWLVLSILF